MRKRTRVAGVAAAICLLATACSGTSSSSARGASSAGTAAGSRTASPRPSNLVPVVGTPLGELHGPIALPLRHDNIQAYSLRTLQVLQAVAMRESLAVKPVSLMVLPEGKAVECGPGAYYSNSGDHAIDAGNCGRGGTVIVIGLHRLAGEIGASESNGAFGALMNAYTWSQYFAAYPALNGDEHGFTACWDGAIVSWLYQAGQVSKAQVLTERGNNLIQFGFDPGFTDGFIGRSCRPHDLGGDELKALLNGGFYAPRR